MAAGSVGGEALAATTPGEHLALVGGVGTTAAPIAARPGARGRWLGAGPSRIRNRGSTGGRGHDTSGRWRRDRKSVV